MMKIYSTREVYECIANAMGVTVPSTVGDNIVYEIEDENEEQIIFLKAVRGYECGYVPDGAKTEKVWSYMKDNGYDYCVEMERLDDTCQKYYEYCDDIANIEKSKKRQVSAEVQRVRKFLKKCPYKKWEKELLSRVVGHEDEVKKMGTNIYMYLTSIANCDEEIMRNHFIIAGPSGSGKTHFIKSVKEIFKKYQFIFDVLIFDTTSITEEGFKGKNVSNLSEEIAETLGNNRYCIVFLDELDKKMLPLFDSGMANVNAAIQSSLLTFIEGSVRTNKSNKGASKTNTNNILFIGAGAFQTVRNEKNKHDTSIGFFEDENNLVEENVEITNEDIINMGSSPEMVGRFTGGVINFSRPDRENMKTIIQNLANKSVGSLPIKVNLSETAINNFTELSQSEYGVRLIKERLQATVSPLLREVFMTNASGRYVFNIEDIEKATLTEVACEENNSF